MTHQEYKQILKEIDLKVKETNGHNYITMLKTRCQNCGRSPKAKGKCGAWLNYFMSLFELKLRGLKIITD